MEAINTNKRRFRWNKKTRAEGGGGASASGAAGASGGTHRASKPSAFENSLSAEPDAIQSEAVSVLGADGSVDLSIVQAMQDEIHIIGDELACSPRMDTALRYKASIQKLLKSVVPHLHRLETTTARKGIKTPSGYDVKEYKYTTIAKINTQLETVLKLVLGTQIDQMRLMQSLDEMKGLIVDLLK